MFETGNRAGRMGVVAILGLAAAAVGVSLFAGQGCNSMAPMNPGQSQAMELRGHWMGLGLAATDSPGGRQFGVLPEMSGVVVAETGRGVDERGIGKMLVPGDVIVGVNGKPITNLTELYTLTTDQNLTNAFPVQVVRAGQPMTITVPPAPGMAPAGLQPGMPSTTMPATVTPAGLGVPTAAATTMPAASSMPGPTSGGMGFFCPNDGLHWTHAQVQPSFTCPKCGGPLTR